MQIALVSVSLVVLLLEPTLSAAQPGWTVWNSHSRRGQGLRQANPRTSNSAEANNEALDLYRLGWATGDVEIILSSVNNSTFTFTWVPTNQVVSPRQFIKFFGDFMAEAEKKTNEKYLMTFDNIIHREVMN